MPRRLAVVALTLAVAGCSRDLDVPSAERVVISPAFANVAPRQTVQLQAAGGAGAYVFEFAEGGKLSGSDASVDASTGLYTAGSAGSAEDVVTVRDGAGRKATAKIQVGTPLQLYRSDTRPVAPHETVAFIAFGGQPPYRFSMVESGSGNPSIGEISGAYTAGDRSADLDPDATVSDTVQVTDSAPVPQTATLSILVGQRLKLRLDAAEVFPGVAAHLVAEGGKPPYAFAFAARVSPAQEPARQNGGNGGNRSNGDVNAFSGDYLPGFSPGAIDFFQVTDSTGAPPAILAGPPVGGVPIAVGTGVRRCMAGDFNGDHSGDAAFAIEGDGTDKLTVAELLDTSDPFVQAYYMQRSARGVSYASDFAGVGRDELVFVGGDTRCDGGSCRSPDLWAMVPDLAGWMSFAQLDPVTATSTLQMRLGAGTYDAASATWTFYTDGSSDGAAYCPGQTDKNRAVLRIDWPVGSPAPTANTCLLAQSFCPGCSSSVYFSPIAFAAGDFDGDGDVDLAWILSTVNNDRVAKGSDGAKVYVSFGDGTSTFPPPRAGWPDDSWSFETEGDSPQSAFMTVKVPSGADALMVRLADGAGHSRLFLLRDPEAAGAWSTSLDPGGSGVDGVVAYAPAPGTETSYLAWSGTDGVLTGFGIDPSLAFTAVSTVATVPFAVNAVCMPDVNADGTPDLVAAGQWSAAAQLLLGDGTVGTDTNGTFAAHAHLRGTTFPVAVGDLDGDGFADVAAPGTGSGLHVLWGGGGMLAWGPQVSSASIGAVAVADFTGEGRPSILYQEKSGRFALVRSRGGGTFDAPVTVPAFAAGGGPPRTYFFAWPGDLGTSAAGLDLLTSEFGDSGIVHALLAQDGRIVDVAAKALPTFDATYDRRRDCWPLAVPTDLASGSFVAAICSFEKDGGSGDQSGVVAVFGAELSNPDGDPGTGGQPALGDWVTLTSTVVNGDEFGRPSTGRASAAFIGNVAPPGGLAGTALFLMRTDRLYAVEVANVGGCVAKGCWTVTPFAVTPVTQAGPFLGAAGRMDLDSAFSVVAAGDDGTVVLKRTGTGYELVQKTSSRAFPLGIGRLAAGSPGDVVTFNGDFSNTGLTPEIVPLLNLNDGTGRVR